MRYCYVPGRRELICGYPVPRLLLRPLTGRRTRWFLSAQLAWCWGSSCELYYGNALELSPGGTSPDTWPATGAWSGSWWLPPNVLLFSQLLALIVVCTVAPSCWNQQEPHVPRKWRAFVPRAVFLFEVFTWAFTCKNTWCKLNARTSNDFRWLSERKESGQNRPTSWFELELSPWITLRQIIPDEWK